MKKKKSWIIWMLCFLLLATALPVVDFTEVQAASTNTGFTGWKTSGSKKYYYKNGKKISYDDYKKAVKSFWTGKKVTFAKIN